MPDSDIVFYNLGLAYFQASEFVEAVAAFEKAVELNDTDGDYWLNLALAHKQLKQFVKAIQAYKQALTLRPEDIDIWYSLGCCCKDCGVPEEAEKVFRYLLEQDGKHISALNNLAYIVHLQGKLDEAEELYGRVLLLAPDHSAATFMLQVLRGEKPETPPTDYIRDLFDHYSDTFDNHLLGQLEYKVPMLMRTLFDQIPPDENKYQNVIDLGCGTGLCGELFRDHAAHLTGIDLSSGMVDISHGKNIYDALETVDIISYLADGKKNYDLFLASDVFSYIGDLEPMFKAISDNSCPQALVGFSVEFTGESGWQVRSSGRFAHSYNYITTVAAQFGLSLIVHERAEIRKEREKWISGSIYFFQKE
ncbi:MAG: tetratricopeptide repeat protein [Desulfobulbaceae bacterium]|nr:tetratricopeptide repeat protein [Desulfobulbaceae bacterium]